MMHWRTGGCEEIRTICGAYDRWVVRGWQREVPPIMAAAKESVKLARFRAMAG